MKLGINASGTHRARRNFMSMTLALASFAPFGSIVTPHSTIFLGLGSELSKYASLRTDGIVCC